MAINFPNAPVNGSTYDYLGVRYTFSKSGVDVGFWHVNAVGTVGIATPAEIDTGTDGAKYITPLSLAAALEWIKLTGVETGATADQSSAEIIAIIAGASDLLKNSMLKNHISGSKQLYNAGNSSADNVNTPTKTSTIFCQVAGTYSVVYTQRRSSNSTTIHSNIYVNGVARGTSHSRANNTPIEYTEDITLSDQDILDGGEIQMYGWVSNTSYSCFIDNFHLNVGVLFNTMSHQTF